MSHENYEVMKNVFKSDMDYILFLDSTKLIIVWIKITTFFKRRVSVIL